MKVVEVRHPLVQHKIGLLRDVALSTKDFRELVTELGTLLAYEATADLETEAATQHGWAIAQELSEHDPAAFNAALIAALGHGQTAVTIRLDDGAGLGLRLAMGAIMAGASKVPRTGPSVP